MYDSLIFPQKVQENLENPNWCFFDCRFELKNPIKKLSEFKVSHIPNAIYVNLEFDLSDPHVSGKTGRHPLPEIKKLIKKFSRWGIDSSMQVVVYDDFDGSHAARFWWILRWLGHEKVAVMDGGWRNWTKENRPLSNEHFVPEEKIFSANPIEHLHVSAEDVLVYSNEKKICILDARNKERYTGENEKIDPVAGHIPFAVSAPHVKNINMNGKWKSKSELRNMYLELLGNCPAEKAVSYCGSGITACQNILAIYYAGLGLTRLYPGSWSDWINDKQRPVELG